MILDPDVELCHKSFFELLIKCPPAQLRPLLHHFVDLFCGQHISLYNSYSDVYSMFEWWNLIDQSKRFLKVFFTQDNATSENWESLPSEYSGVLKDVLDVRASDLKSELIEKSHAVSPAYLKSFDWKLKVSLASDKMSHLCEPRLLLDLDISADKDKCLQLDLNKEELKSLINEMEKAKKTVVKFMAD